MGPGFEKPSLRTNSVGTLKSDDRKKKKQKKTTRYKIPKSMHYEYLVGSDSINLPE